MTQVIHATDSSTDSKQPKAVAQEVEAALEAVGLPNTLMDRVTVPDHVVRADNGLRAGGAVNLRLSDDIRGLVQDTTVWQFSVDTDLPGYFGESRGSANVATLFVRDGLTITEVIQALADQGQLESALKAIRNKRDDSDPPANDILAYALALYAKGWMAERILARTDRFRKGSASQDAGGLDLFDTERGEWVQVKPVTTAASDGIERYKTKDAPHLFYQWDMEEGLFAGYEEAVEGKDEVNRAAKQYTGHPVGTVLKTTSPRYRFQGRTYRHLWWE